MSILLLALGLLCLAFAFQGSRGIFAPDEGYYTGVAQAMLSTGDWLIPRVQHEPWLEKPPLSLWGIAAGMRMLGQNEWGARFFHGLCFAITTVIVFFLGKSMWSRREGLLGATMYCTMVIPFGAGNVVTPDTPLALWTTASFFCFWKSIEPGARRVVLWKMLMCAAFGLGFLTKGPAALIPSGAMVVFLVLQRRLWRYLLTPWAVLGFGLFCIFGLGWYLYVARELPGALAYFWDNEVFGRALSDKYNRNPGLAGMLIYLPVVVLGTLPWSLIWWRSLMHSGRRIVAKSFWIELGKHPAELFLVTWMVVPLVILCAASSKLPLYVLPVFPAFAFSCARLWPSSSRTEAWRGNPLGFSRGMSIALVVWVVGLLGLKSASAHWPHERDMQRLYGSIQKRLPKQQYEIVCIKEHLEGLGFYDHSLVERVTTKETPYPLFIPPEQLNEEIEEIRTSKYAHVLLCRKEGRAKMVRERLADANIVFEQSTLPYRRYMFVCRPARKDPYMVRLITLGDAGKGKGTSRQFSVASALYLLYAEKTFDDGVLLLGDNIDYRTEDSGGVADALRRGFEKPFADLLREGVPFYAALGNHDYEPGVKEFELGYAPFHMAGRRYYSQSFGGGLVETFMLDSNTLQGKGTNPDPGQVAWLQQSLSQSKAVWKVVVLHHPLYSTAMKYPSDPNMIELLEPIFRQYHVSIVVQGHNHLYERLAPIHGVTYITGGSAGTVSKGNLRRNAPERLAGNDQTEVFLMLEFDKTTCQVTAYDALASVIDEATVSLGVNANSADPPPWGRNADLEQHHAGTVAQE